jgi:aspartate/methionine/tyrosine aminotransferase
MIGPADLIKAAQNLQSHSTSNVANVAQAAALAAVIGSTRRRVRDAGGLRSSPPHHALAAFEHRGCAVPRAPGCLLRLPRLLCAARQPDRRTRRVDTTLDLADVLLEQAKVAVVPGEAFGVGGGARCRLPSATMTSARVSVASPTSCRDRRPDGHALRRVAVADHRSVARSRRCWHLGVL